MIPALCVAISSNVCPRNSIWSSLIEVITLTFGQITLVASYLPPIPVSIIQISGCSSWKITIAIRNTASKNDGLFFPSVIPVSMACLTFTAADANRSSLISFAHSLIRSLIFTTCGEVKEAVFFPCWVRSASKNAQTDPFPFVPATWIICSSFWGFPNRSKKYFISSREDFVANPAILYKYFTDSS